MTTNLQQYKKTKKLSKVVEDLATINKLFNTILLDLTPHKKYRPVKEVISSVLDNKAMVDIFLKKFKKSLDENKLD